MGENAGTTPGVGALSGLRVVELGGVGPAPFAAMLLADMGADVIRVDRVGQGQHQWDDDEQRSCDVIVRGRRSIAIDLKHPDGVDIALRLVRDSDVLIEGMRPGVCEALGLGPDACRELNPRLVYGRVTGWGQDGPYAQMAGHDINYIAVAGVLEGIGRPGAPPTPPLTLVGDFAGGGMFLSYGILAALLEQSRSGEGQVVDAAMVEGAAVLNSIAYSALAWGFDLRRGENLWSGASPHYDAYECADGRWITLAPMEPAFYQSMRDKLGLFGELWDEQFDSSRWPQRKQELRAIIRERTQPDWCALLEGTDVCFAPVMGLADVRDHPQNRARETFVEHFGVLQPAPAPRLSRTPSRLGAPPPLNGQHTHEVLSDLGYIDSEIADFVDRQIVGVRPSSDPGLGH